MSKKEVALGIDVGGTNTKLGFVDQDGQCLAPRSIYSHAKESADFFVANLAKEVKKMHEEAPDVEVKAVGIGAPNGNFYSGSVEQAPNLNWGDKVPLVEMVQDKVHSPAFLTNDANAAAIGEMKYGVARGMKNFVVITLGTGLGSGIVVNGDLVYGHDGFAGELGHTIIKREGRDCNSGVVGALETYVSASGICRTIFMLLAKRLHPSRFRDVTFNNLTANQITEAALEGDKIAQEAFEYTGKLLGFQLADTVAHLSPEAIILFGGLANAGDLIVEPTKRHMEANLLPIFRNKVQILLSNLKGENTAVLGSAALAWNEYDKMK